MKRKKLKVFIIIILLEIIVLFILTCILIKTISKIPTTKNMDIVIKKYIDENQPVEENDEFAKFEIKETKTQQTQGNFDEFNVQHSVEGDAIDYLVETKGMYNVDLEKERMSVSGDSYSQKQSETSNITWYKDEHEELQTSENSKYELIRLSIETQGNVKEESVDLLVNEIATTVPPWLLDIFIRNKWKIQLTTYDIATLYYDTKAEVEGTTMYVRKRIILEEWRIKDALLHEFGHFFDQVCLGDSSSSEEFKQIYNEEVKQFKSQIDLPGCVTDERELFAEGFYQYIAFPDKCTPKLYDYIQRKCNDFQKAIQN